MVGKAWIPCYIDRMKLDEAIGRPSKDPCGGRNLMPRLHERNGRGYRLTGAWIGANIILHIHHGFATKVDITASQPRWTSQSRNHHLGCSNVTVHTSSTPASHQKIPVDLCRKDANMHNEDHGEPSKHRAQLQRGGGPVNGRDPRDHDGDAGPISMAIQGRHAKQHLPHQPPSCHDVVRRQVRTGVERAPPTGQVAPCSLHGKSRPAGGRDLVPGP